MREFAARRFTLTSARGAVPRRRGMPSSGRAVGRTRRRGGRMAVSGSGASAAEPTLPAAVEGDRRASTIRSTLFGARSTPDPSIRPGWARFAGSWSPTTRTRRAGRDATIAVEGEAARRRVPSCRYHGRDDSLRQVLVSRGSSSLLVSTEVPIFYQRLETEAVSRRNARGDRGQGLPCWPTQWSFNWE